VEDGQCGDISTLTTTEEPGLGLPHNLIQIAEPSELIILLLMIRIFIFLISINFSLID
jgi:hypothetical protein